MTTVFLFDTISHIQIKSPEVWYHQVWDLLIFWTMIIPSGKQPHNYGKSPCLMGKLTINGHVQ